MTWTEAVDAMKNGHFVRRSHWGRFDIIRFKNEKIEFPNNSQKRSCLFSEENVSVDFNFILEDLCATDWVISEFTLDKNDKWVPMR